MRRAMMRVMAVVFTLLAVRVFGASTASAQSCSGGGMTVNPCSLVVKAPTATNDSLVINVQGWPPASASVACTSALQGCSADQPGPTIGGVTRVVIRFQTPETPAAAMLNVTLQSSLGTLSLPYQILIVPAMTLTPVYDTLGYTDPAWCLAGCSEATAAVSTAPFVTMNTPRAVTLVYRQNRALPRPFGGVDVTLLPHANTVHNYQMTAWVGEPGYGTQVMFLGAGLTATAMGNLDPSQRTMRLAAQADGRSFATGVYPVNLVVRAEFTSGFVETQTLRTNVTVVNEVDSPIASGWGIAGVQRVVFLANGYLVTDGDGSTAWFPTLGSFTLDHSTLTASGSGYVRRYVDGSVVTFSATGYMTSIADRLGRTTTFEYTGTQLTKIKEPMRTRTGAGRYIALSYNAQGLASITEGAPGQSRTTTIAVDANRRLTRVTDPDGFHTDFAYDSIGRLTSTTDRRGATTSLTYDTVSWLVTRVTSPAVPLDIGGGATNAGAPDVRIVPWQTIGVIASTTPVMGPQPDTIHGAMFNALGERTLWTPDAYGRAVSLTDPQGTTTQFLYSGAELLKVTRPNATWDSTEYNGSGLPVTKISSDQSIVYFGWGPNGQFVSAYGDGLREVTRFLDPQGSVDSIRYVGSGTIPTTVYRYTYDPATKQVATFSDGGGHVTVYHYDALTGNLDSTAMAGNRWSKIRFDAYGRDSLIITPTQPTRTIGYDVMNRVTRVWDGVNSLPTVFRYDPLFRTSVINAKNELADSTVYNALGWVVARHDLANPLLVTTYRYDRGGRPTSWTNRRGMFGTIGYDSAGRLVTKSTSGTGFDKVWRSVDGTKSRSWNDIDTVATYAVPLQSRDSVVTSFGAKRLRVLHTYPTSFDGVDSVVMAGNILPNPVVRQFWRDPLAGSLVGIDVGGERSSFAYNADGLLDSVVFPVSGIRQANKYTKLHQGWEQSYSATGNEIPGLHSLTFHDELGRISVEQKIAASLYNSNQRRFSYDGLGRLITVETRTGCVNGTADSASGSALNCSTILSTEQYTYDAAGNRTDHGGVTGPGNRQTQLNGYFLEYDLDGNVTRKYNAALTVDTRYTWDAENRLSRVRNALTGATVDYQYNASGNLAQRLNTSGTVDRRWIWDGGHILTILDSVYNEVANYTYSPGVDRPYAWERGGNMDYYVLDDLGNVTGTFYGARVNYDPWGAPTFSQTGTGTLLWKGLHWEDSPAIGGKGLYYMRARWYDPEVGRFLSEDPAGYDGSSNRYVFSDNDPINGKDPTGMWSLTCTYTHYYVYINGKLVDDWRVPDECWLEPDLIDILMAAIRGLPEPKSRSAPPEKKRNVDLCSAVPNGPPTADLNANIGEASKHLWNASWFKKQVQNRGPWDYKRKGTAYENFGNFNYGATGDALGVPTTVLLRAAGGYQQTRGAASAGVGTWWGRAPYGDDPKDQFWIRLGVSYAQVGAQCSGQK